jgi:4'-phosphopantetheinyl transferase
VDEVMDDEVRVYVARTANVDAALADALVTDDERTWLRTFRFERDRHEHLVSRALVRASLAKHLGVAPRSVGWTLGEHGKPALAPRGPLFFNASNHRDVVVCAIARHEELGVDVEPFSRGDDILDVVGTVFSTAEIAALRALPLDERRRRAVTLWTLKEAYIKALGLGFVAPLLSITIDHDAAPPQVTGEAGWFLDFADRHDVRIAVAVRGPSTRPRLVLADGEPLIAGS